MTAHDAADLTKLRANDARAWESLHHQYAGFVHGLILSGAPKGEDIEGLTQEVFLRVFRNIKTVKSTNQLQSWLRTTTRNLLIDVLRARARKPNPVEIPESGLKAKRDGPTDVQQQIMARIQSLPDAYREPLILRLVEGLNGPRIAELTGMTHQSVRVNLSRGMAKLRTLLEKDGLP